MTDTLPTDPNAARPCEVLLAHYLQPVRESCAMKTAAVFSVEQQAWDTT